MQIRKATAEEKASYWETKPIYPLYGYAMVSITLNDCGQCNQAEKLQVPVEDLRGSWSPPDPIYEARAPDGWNFSGELHGLLGINLKDMRDRLDYEVMHKCKPDCNCGIGDIP